MGTLSIESSVTVDLRGGSGTSYQEAHDVGVAYTRQLNETTMICGQLLQVSSPQWNVIRAAMTFDLSGLPDNAEITGVTLKVYGHSDSSTDDFLLTACEVDLSVPQAYSDYANFETTDFGNLTTVGVGIGSFNSITINAAGLVYLNSAVQAGTVDLGLRSSKDISETAPTQSEFVIFKGQNDSNRPILEITFSDWPNELYPTPVAFPSMGKIDLATYSVIRNQMTGLDDDLSILADGDGNLDLAVANWITWTGTSEKIAFDSGTSHVTVTTLESTSAITIAADLVTADPSITTTATAVDCSVANDAQLSTTAYASIQSKVTDNEVVFSASVAPTPDDDWGNLYMDSTSGDFVMKTRDDGQAGTKTHILGDFSAM